MLQSILFLHVRYCLVIDHQVGKSSGQFLASFLFDLRNIQELTTLFLKCSLSFHFFSSTSLGVPFLTSLLVSPPWCLSVEFPKA